MAKKENCRVEWGFYKNFKILLFTIALFGNQNFSHANNNSIRIESLFQPPTITLAGQSTYKVIIHGSQENPQGSIPQIPGISISNSPQVFRSASFINGIPSVRLELSFNVTPKAVGTHTIPKWQMQIGKSAFLVPDAILKVLPPNQQDIIRKNEQEKQEENLKQASFIEFSNPRPYLFEGETVSTEINLFIWDRLPVSRIERAPQKEGDSISISEMGQPLEKRNQIRFNKSYTVFSWPISMTTAIAGKHNLKFNTSIRVRVKSRGNSPFNSPFFNDPFFGFGREESLTVLSDNHTINVKPLPLNNRPKSFSGAIGKFSISTSIDSDSISLGDPIRYKVDIEGKGNFSAMPAPPLESDEIFKIGPPAFSFDGNEITMFEGIQSFEYVISPLKSGLLEVPSITFSYFDPLQEEYFVTKTKIHKINVDPGQTWIDPSEESSSEEENVPEIKTSDYFQTENEPGSWVLSLEKESIITSKLFWSLQSIPMLSTVVLFLYGLKRKRSGRDIFRKKLSLLTKQMKDAIAYDDPELFFKASRERIRLEIGTLYKRTNPASLSSQEIISLLGNGSNNENLIEEIDDVLQRIDDYEFADREKNFPTLENLDKKINTLLKKLK